LRGPLLRRRPVTPALSPVEVPDDEIDALREKIADLLSPTAVSRDELVRLTGAPAAAVYGALVELSIAGRAELRPGGLVLGA
jgi:DNA processing protein